MNSEKQTTSKPSGDAQSFDPDTETPDILTIFLMMGGVFGLFVMLATFSVSGLQLNSGDNARFALGTGQFGDSFGFVTSIFTGLAFLGLLISVRLQRKELAELKKEMIHVSC